MIRNGAKNREPKQPGSLGLLAWLAIAETGFNQATDAPHPLARAAWPASEPRPGMPPCASASRGGAAALFRHTAVERLDVSTRSWLERATIGTALSLIRTSCAHDNDGIACKEQIKDHLSVFDNHIGT